MAELLRPAIILRQLPFYNDYYQFCLNKKRVTHLVPNAQQLSALVFSLDTLDTIHLKIKNL